MKKKVILIIAIISALILLIPFPQHLKDGGSVEYKALLYTVTKYHQLAPITAGAGDGYIDGIGIEILGMEVYRNMEAANGEQQGSEVADNPGIIPISADDDNQVVIFEDVVRGDTNILRGGINQFAYHMYDELDAGENLFFSPYSLCAALSLLDVGAGTETKAELEEMLGITDLDAWNAAIKAYLEKPWAEETFVLTANSVWMQQDKEWSETMETAFLQPAGFYYNSELYEVDFLGNNEMVTAQVNDWANRNTNGMIPKVMDKVPADTVMALMNAVYFEGKWETPFDPDDTYEQTFYGTDGERQVEMMHQYGEYYAYVEESGMKGIALPYKEAGVVMKIFVPVLPEDNKGIENDAQVAGEAASANELDVEALFAALSTEEKEALLNSLDEAPTEEITRLAVPKFTMELGIDGLVDILKDMGMETAFLPEADFDSIAEDIYVSDVIHKAKIEMDEDGTKAAAVTVVTMTESAAMIEEPPVIFEADRPFVYFLQDVETGMILFMGRVNSLE